jgi:hypothetical protein
LLAKTGPHHVAAGIFHKVPQALICWHERGEFMTSSRLGAVLAGVILIVMGVLAFASTIGRPAEDTTRNVSLLLVSFGSMWVALVFYLEARKLRAEYQPPSPPVAVAPKRTFALCAVCGLPTASLWCTTHTIKICPECLPQHDDPKRCLYKTVARTPSSPARN